MGADGLKEQSMQVKRLSTFSVATILNYVFQVAINFVQLQKHKFHLASGYRLENDESIAHNCPIKKKM